MMRMWGDARSPAARNDGVVSVLGVAAIVAREIGRERDGHRRKNGEKSGGARCSIGRWRQFAA